MIISGMVLVRFSSGSRVLGRGLPGVTSRRESLNSSPKSRSTHQFLIVSTMADSLSAKLAISVAKSGKSCHTSSVKISGHSFSKDKKATIFLSGFIG